MKAKRISTFSAIALLLCLSGCSLYIVNLTPKKFPPSTDGAYTIRAKVETNRQDVVPDSFEAFVVIDGNQLPMRRQLSDNPVFEYNYKPPSDNLTVRFYYVLNYLVKSKNAAPILKQFVSNLYQAQLPDTEFLVMDKQRAAVGTRVAVYGDEFTEQDRVLIDGTPCETIFVSSKELQFLVPEIKPSFGYAVDVFTSGGMLKAGLLRVDPANPLSVLPKTLELKVGQPKALAFMLSYPAPYGGLYIDITTDIPDSIIMPEVLIPERARTVSATIKGKYISNGNLFIKAGDLPEIIVPVTVR